MNKIVLISYSFESGGAGIAALKFSQLLKSTNLKVELISQDKAGKYQLFKRVISYFLTIFQYDKNSIKHSLNLFSFEPVINNLKNNKYDLHHLHWINNDTLSIFNFNKIPKGSIFTLHDEWLYCGSEHCYKVDDVELDFIKGYTFLKRDVIGLHLNYLVWRIKKWQLKSSKHIIYTVPSKWMMNRAKISAILHDKDVRYLPNPIDHLLFYPKTKLEVASFRKQYLLDSDDIVICFGALGGRRNKLKGGDILLQALSIIRNTLYVSCLKDRIVLLEFGGKTKIDQVFGFKRISLGRISDSNKLALIYSVADITVVPSLVESFGQVAAESLACETPVVCFGASGITDIVTNNESGYYCEPFKASSLAEQLIRMVSLSSSQRKDMGKLGRAHVINKFSYDNVRSKYLDIIKDAKEIKERFK